MTSDRDNFKAGLFILIGVVALLAVVFTLADFKAWTEKFQDVKVYYQLDDGLGGLKEGATVTLGDQPIGDVTKIEDVLEENSGRVIGKLVTVSIPSRFKIHENAAIELKSPPLGSGTKLNIRSVGMGKVYDPNQPPPRDRIVGELAGSPLTASLMKDAGIEELQRQQIKSIIANVDSVTTTLKDNAPDMVAKVNRILDNVEPLSADAKIAAADLRETTTHAKEFVADVRARATAWMDRIDAVTVKADESMTTVRDLLKEKDETIRTSLDNVKETTQNVREISTTARDRTMTQITDALYKADAAMENLKTSTSELKAFVIGQRPVLERAVANYQLTADQLKLAAIEVRRSPWRLLYKPTDKEIANDNLYDAARSFAQAAGTLDAAAASLRDVSQKDGSPEQVRKSLDHLEALFKKYEEAEAEFWKALKDRKPAN